MIQSAAPTLTADLAKVAGKAHGGSAKSTGEGSFSAILGDTDTAASDIVDAPATATAEAAMLVAAVAGGKTGKATGKILPETAAAAPGKSKTDAESENDSDLDTDGLDTDGLETDASLTAAVPFALAGMLQVPLTTTAGQTASPSTANEGLANIATVAAVDTQKLLPTLPDTAIANAAAKGLAQSSASDRALAVHQLLSATAATTEAPSAIDMAANAQRVVTVAPAETAASIPVPAQLATAGTPAVDQAVATIKLAPIEVVAAATPATNVQLAARTARLSTSRTAAPMQAGVAPQVAATQIASSTGEQAAMPAQKPASLAISNDAQDGQTIRPGTAKTAQGEIETGERTPAARAAVTTAIPTIAVDVTPTQPAISTPAATQAAAPAQGPQDFATLVSRLNEAREAADPQFVRTAINHTEFGQISLEFRHKGDGLAVTMASSDPVFASTVQAAASASLASNTSSGGDDAKQQQQQQYQPASSQQQAASSGTGTGSGTSQNQQARADQAGQSTNRGQGSASRTQDQEASAPRQNRDGTRRGGGVYA